MIKYEPETDADLVLLDAALEHGLEDYPMYELVIWALESEDPVLIALAEAAQEE